MMFYTRGSYECPYCGHAILKLAGPWREGERYVMQAECPECEARGPLVTARGPHDNKYEKVLRAFCRPEGT
jgi:predicted RNA-binding Zn-ribbon protein involved in translation (DUF1610 family)